MARIKKGKTKNSLLANFVLAMIVLVCVYGLVCAVRKAQYTPDVYTCRYMGRDLEAFLNSLNIDTRIVVGESTLSDSRHLWVAVNMLGLYIDVDSVYFYPFMNRFIYTNIEVYDSYTDYERQN